MFQSREMRRIPRRLGMFAMPIRYEGTRASKISAPQQNLRVVVNLLPDAGTGTAPAPVPAPVTFAGFLQRVVPGAGGSSRSSSSSSIREEAPRRSISQANLSATFGENNPLILRKGWGFREILQITKRIYACLMPVPKPHPKGIIADCPNLFETRFLIERVLDNF